MGHVESVKNEQRADTSEGAWPAEVIQEIDAGEEGCRTIFRTDEAEQLTFTAMQRVPDYQVPRSTGRCFSEQNSGSIALEIDVNLSV